MKSLRTWALLLPLLALAGQSLGKEAPAPSKVLKLRIDGTIHAGTTSMLESALKAVKEGGHEALLIELDTPGGLLDSTRDIVKLFLNTDVPILVHVAPRGAHAGSAGTFITMAAHVAGMAPGTNIGAAHPISATGSDPEKEGGKHLARKVENDTVAFVESIAKQRGRNAEWAKRAVVESEAITEEKAVELKVIDFVAKDTAEFLARADGRDLKLASKSHRLATKNAAVEEFHPDPFTKFKNWLANPAVMFILLMIAGMGLYIEMSHPGLILPAVLAGIAILLVMIATSVLPISAIGVGLIVVGFVLLAMELYVASHGLLATGGIAALVIGALLLFDPAESDLRVPRSLIAGAALGFGSIALIIAVAVSKNFHAKQIAGSEGLVGTRAVVDETLAPGKDGRILMNGEYWNASSDQEIEKGASVEVIRVDGLKAHVRRVG